MSRDRITLRLARAGDAAVMSAMSRDFIETGLGWRYSPPRIAALIGDAETVALTACDEGGVQGFAVMQFGDEHAHLVLMCVNPARRRQGVAKRLIEWLLASARVAGLASVELELRADNTAAHGLYTALGFAETVLVPGYYQGRVAARRMQLLLRLPRAAE